jgi:hypothetical protein
MYRSVAITRSIPLKATYFDFRTFEATDLGVRIEVPGGGALMGSRQRSLASICATGRSMPDLLDSVTDCTGKALSGPVRLDARLIMLPTHVEDGTLVYVYDDKANDVRTVPPPTTSVAAADGSS